MSSKPEYLWLYVSGDKYELPLAMADTARELGEVIGKSTDAIHSAVKNGRKYGRLCRYVKVDISGVDDE